MRGKRGGPSKAWTEGSCEEPDLPDPLDSKGFHLPRSRTPWLWVISTTTDLHTRHVPREPPKHYFLNFEFLTLRKNKSHVLWKSLMRCGHVRELLQTHPLFRQMLTVVPQTTRGTPNVTEAGPLEHISRMVSCGQKVGARFHSLGSLEQRLQIQGV